MNYKNQYVNYKKPFFAPPAWIFGPVWTFLYLLIAISFGFVGYLFLKNEISFLVVFPFLLNLIFNFSFTYFQFKLNNNLLATIDVLFVLASLIWALIVIFPFAPWVFYINIPYILWVSFASILQLSVTWLNK